MRHTLNRKVVAVAVVCCLFASVIGVSVVSAARTGSETNSTANGPAPWGAGFGAGSSAPNASTNTSANETNASRNVSGGSGGGWFGSGIGSSVGNTVGSIAQKAMKTAMSPILLFATEVPQINIGVWRGNTGQHPPSNFPYKSLTPLIVFGYALLSPISTALIFKSGWEMANPRSTNPYNGARKLLRTLAATVASACSLLFFSLIYYSANTAIKLVRPSAADLTSSTGSMIKTIVGAVATGVALTQLGWEFVKWMAIIYSAIWFGLVVIPLVGAILIFAMIRSPSSKLGQICGSIVWIDLGLIVSKICEAILLNVAWRLNWGVSLHGMMAAFMSIGILFVALITPIVVTAIFVMSKSWAVRTALSAGMGAFAGFELGEKARAHKEKLVERGREKISEKHESVKERTSNAAKKGAVKAQSKWWDTKSRAKAAGSTIKGGPAGALAGASERIKTAHKRAELESSLGDVEPTGDSGSKISTAERLRNMEHANDRAGGSGATRRNRYMYMKLEQDGAIGPDRSSAESGGNDGK